MSFPTRDTDRVDVSDAEGRGWAVTPWSIDGERSLVWSTHRTQADAEAYADELRDVLATWDA